MSPYRAISADLWFANSGEDSATVFVDCLVRLPNLRTLDVLFTSRVNTVKQELKLGGARFSSIRGLLIGDELLEFIENCPNVESVMVRDTPLELLRYCPESHSDPRGLFTNGTATEFAEDCPNIKEVSIRDKIENIRIPIMSPQLPGAPEFMRLSILRRLIRNQLNTCEHWGILPSWISNLPPLRITWVKLQQQNVNFAGPGRRWT